MINCTWAKDNLTSLLATSARPRPSVYGGCVDTEHRSLTQSHNF